MMILNFLRKIFGYFFDSPRPIISIQNLPTLSIVPEKKLVFPIWASQPDGIKSHKQGLPNVGNTCYLNALLQVLSSTPDFVQKLPSNSKICVSLSRVISWVQQKGRLSIFAEIKKLQLYLFQEFRMFNEHSENDPKELYLSLMGLLPDSSDFSIILYKKILCKLCHNFSNLEEPSLFCILKNPSKKEIEEKLKNLEEEKEYKGGNLLYCENCSANREMVMSTFGINIPNIFVFYIGNVLGKRAQGAYNFFYCGDKFELYGVICYYNSGCRHYIAYTLDNAEWMQYNDDHISYSSPDFEHAYMLFYKKT